jgi:polyisoprenoid-binding protein YceI
MIRRIVATTSVAVFCAALTAGAAFGVTANVAKSTVSVVFKQMNVPVEDRFNHFAADVRFDPANVAGSSARLDVEVGSLDLGSPDYNQEVAGGEWFDVAHFPHATFVSTRIEPAATGAYSVEGKLTIKGKTADVVVPVQYHKDGPNQVFDGTLPIKRLAFNIGTGEWKDTSVVADDVQIKFHLVVVAH